MANTKVSPTLGIYEFFKIEDISSVAIARKEKHWKEKQSADLYIIVQKQMDCIHVRNYKVHHQMAILCWNCFYMLVCLSATQKGPCHIANLGFYYFVHRKRQWPFYCIKYHHIKPDETHLWNHTWKSVIFTEKVTAKLYTGRILSPYFLWNSFLDILPSLFYFKWKKNSICNVLRCADTYIYLSKNTLRQRRRITIKPTRWLFMGSHHSAIDIRGPHPICSGA